MKPLRTAILGCGDFANHHAKNLISMQDQFELAAFCDIIPERAQAFKQKYANQARLYSDFHPMLDEIKPDLLFICLPPYGHTDEVAAAAVRGIHIFIEKPLGLSSEQAWKMVEAAEATKIKTQVGFMFRFGAAVTELKSLIASGKAGELGLMSARYFCNSLHSIWWRRRDKSGGQLVEQVIHLVDLMRYVMGDAQTVYSLQNNLFHGEVPDYTVEDVSGTVVGFKNGGIGVIYATNGAVPGKWESDYRVVARNLIAEFSDANHATFTYTGGPYLQNVSIASDQDTYRLELLDLVNAIETGGDTRTPLREGALSLDLALAGARSAASAAVVKL